MGEKKLVPKRRFKAFELDWEEKSFESLAEIVRGASPRPIEDPKWFDSNSNTGWLRISDVTSQNGRIINLEQKISVLGQQKTRVLTNSHLLLSIAATVGKPVINYVKTGVHDGFLIFLKPKFDIEYMYQWLEMFRSKWQQYGQPGSQVNLNSDIVKKHILLIPGIEEQQKIGKFFKILDERIANQERKIAKVKALKSAYLTEMFPQKGETVPKRRFKGFEDEWEREKLGNVAEYRRGSFPQPYGEEKWYDVVNGMPFVQVVDVAKNLRLVDDTKQKISKLAQPSSVYVETGKVLVTLQGSIGRVAITQYPAYVDRTLLIFEDYKYKVDIYYFAYIIQLLFEVEKQKAPGGTIKTITKEALSEFIIKFPNYHEQQKIGIFFKNLDNQIEMEEKKLDKLQKMKEAYLGEMFV